MPDLFNLVFVMFFIIVLISLGLALFYLSSDKKDSHHMAKILTLRVALSFLLIALLLFGFFSGLIHPNIL